MNFLKICRSLLVWICFIPVAVLNGGLRQHVLVGWLGPVWAMIVSGILLSLLILLVTWALLPRVVNLTRKERLAAGFLWMFLTVGFECVAGLVDGLSFRELLEAYNPSEGNLWLLVVITTLLAPVLVVAPHDVRPDASMHDRVVELYRGELWECQLLETLLGDTGVECFLRNDVRNGYGPIVSPAQQVQVMINESDFEKGSHVLASFLESRKGI